MHNSQLNRRHCAGRHLTRTSETLWWTCRVSWCLPVGPVFSFRESWKVTLPLCIPLLGTEFPNCLLIWQIMFFVSMFPNCSCSSLCLFHQVVCFLLAGVDGYGLVSCHSIHTHLLKVFICMEEWALEKPCWWTCFLINCKRDILIKPAAFLLRRWGHSSSHDN